MKYTLTKPIQTAEGERTEVEIKPTLKAMRKMPIPKPGETFTMGDSWPMVEACTGLFEKEFYALSLEDRGGLIAAVMDELGKPLAA